MTSRPDARIPVTAGSQLSRLPVKCCRNSRGHPAPPPKRRYAYVSFFAWRNCVGAVTLLGTIIKVDILIHPLSEQPPATLLADDWHSCVWSSSSSRAAISAGEREL